MEGWSREERQRGDAKKTPDPEGGGVTGPGERERDFFLQGARVFLSEQVDDISQVDGRFTDHFAKAANIFGRLAGEGKQAENR